jgi:type III pantothenate kinase
VKPNVVVDVGNSRIKWGLCATDGISLSASLPASDPAAWQAQLDTWKVAGPFSWAVSGVHPERRDELVNWLRQRGDAVWLVQRAEQLLLRVLLPHPDWVGIDRLLAAVAARSRVFRPAPVIIVDAGSAVTVDLLDATHAFRGGAIFPGLRLMAQALHEHTALLPLIEVKHTNPPLPGTDTPAAMEAGVFWAVAGGIKALVRQLAARARSFTDPDLSGPPPQPPVLFLTGGDAPLLEPVMDTTMVRWPDMTLEGLRLSAAAQP